MTNAELAEIAKHFICVDCHIDTSNRPSGINEYYMVKDEVWQSVVPEDADIYDNTMLCIGCLETRLRRRLTHNDFSDAPLNDLSIAMHRSHRLRTRIAG